MKVTQITPKSRGAKKMASKKVREYFSENARQSFCAEGVCYSKEYWETIEKKYRKSKQSRLKTSR